MNRLNSIILLKATNNKSLEIRRKKAALGLLWGNLSLSVMCQIEVEHESTFKAAK